MSLSTDIAPDRRKVIATKLKYLQEKKGWSRKDLTEKLGRGESYISRLLKGDMNLTLETLEDLERTLGEPLLTESIRPSKTSIKATHSLNLKKTGAKAGLDVYTH